MKTMHIGKSLPILQIPMEIQTQEIKEEKFEVPNTKVKSEEIERKNLNLISPRKKEIKMKIKIKDDMHIRDNKKQKLNLSDLQIEKKREMSRSEPIQMNIVKAIKQMNDNKVFYFKEIDIGGYPLFVAPKIPNEESEEYYNKKNLSKLLKQEHKSICMIEPYLTPKMKFHEKQVKYPSSCSFSNYSKNRYQDVLCNEHSKFVFFNDGTLHESMNEISLEEMLFDMNKIKEEEERYINANYIKGTHQSNSVFIATQAPLEKTLPEFFEMVWQSNSKVIVALTSLVENKTVKMFPYWPSSSKKPLIVSHFEISICEENQFENNIVIRKMSVKNICSSIVREIYQVHYSGWPDNDVPDHPISLIQIYDHQKKLEKQGLLEGLDGPSIVHCSAGIGRAATYTSFVFASQITTFLKNNTSSFSRTNLNLVLDIPSIVLNIRKQRTGSVTTWKQYALIYKAINYFIQHHL
eukprot:TRINITY_DN13882_c0_g1_i1.p1 TRINITY_DN13882_c0_g1~~TRINITY_DN13882_c0_g1_i1.p1  ORF type:complete len:464 (+),score=131.01 TRINITY_DN13882_c0_g1_i1:27-1418(+)